MTYNFLNGLLISSYNTLINELEFIKHGKRSEPNTRYSYIIERSSLTQVVIPVFQDYFDSTKNETNWTLIPENEINNPALIKKIREKPHCIINQENSSLEIVVYILLRVSDKLTQKQYQHIECKKFILNTALSGNAKYKTDLEEIENFFNRIISNESVETVS